MIDKKMLENYAEKLMFRMKDDELNTLENEFDTILKQMKLIENIKGIEKVNPMTFPFITYEAKLRSDLESSDSLSVDEVVSNTKHVVKDQIKVPKVVE